MFLFSKSRGNSCRHKALAARRRVFPPNKMASSKLRGGSAALCSGDPPVGLAEAGIAPAANEKSTKQLIAFGPVFPVYFVKDHIGMIFRFSGMLEKRF